MWCPILLGLTYMMFNVIYILAFDGTSANGEDFIYSVLDWKNNLGWALFFVGMSLVGFPLLFGLFYLLAMFRDYLWRKCLNIQDEDPNVATSLNTNGVYSISIKLQDKN